MPKYTIEDAPAVKTDGSKYTVEDAPADQSAPPITQPRPVLTHVLSADHPLSLFKGMWEGVKGIVTHPINTGASMGEPFAATGMAPGGMYPTTAPLGTGPTGQRSMALNDEVQRRDLLHQGEVGDEMKAHPFETTGQVLGPMLLTHALMKAGVAIPRVARGGADIIAGTGIEPVKGLVKNTQAANTKIAAGNEAATQSHLEDTQNALHDTTGNELQYQQQLKQKAADIQAQRLAESAKHSQESTLQTQRQAAMNHVTSNADPIRTKLNQTYESAKAVADQKYNSLREALGGEEADPKRIQDAFLSATENLQDSNSLPPVLKLMEKNLKEGPLDYSDLQGIRTKLGEAMKPGKMLPADVHFAYKSLLDDISNEMSEVGKRADEANPDHEGPSYADQLKDAQGYYRHFADTFYSPKSPIRRALNTPDPVMRATQLGKMGRFAGEDKPATAALSVYDPEAAQMADAYHQALQTAKGIKEKKLGEAPSYSLSPEEEAAQAVPQNTRVAPPERPVETPKKVIEPLDIQKAKTEAMATRAQKARGGGSFVNTVSALDAIRNVVKANPAGLAVDLGARGLYGVAKGAYARLLENPAVIDFLTKPTPRDVAAIPPDIRGNLGPIIQAARAGGIKVHLAIQALVGMGGQAEQGAASASQSAQ